MFKKVLTTILNLFLILLLVYLALPSPSFPAPPLDSIQSHEPADSESDLRRAYFTNYTRAEVMDWYKIQFKKDMMGVTLPIYTLNYGPEEATTIIRDQTRSTFLEEIVHPFREGVYINGFEPKDTKDNIFIEGRSWRQKITVRYVPSNLFVRLAVWVGVVVSINLLLIGWKKSLSSK